MKLLSIFVCIFTALSVVNAKTYYFSSSSGDDTRTAIQAQSSASPWKSLNKLNSFFPSLQPGDSVLLKRGETFYGQIVVSKSGILNSPIIISAYGTGIKPTISGFINLINWIDKGNGLWEVTNNSLSEFPNVFTLNGKTVSVGRYPNKNTSNGGYLIYENHTGNTQIIDNELSSSPDWTGAEIVIRKNSWIIDRGKLDKHSGTTLKYSGTSSYEPQNNHGYFIQNHISTLDQVGEWCYDKSSKKVTLRIHTGLNANTQTVKAACVNNLVQISSRNYLKFQNVNFEGANNTCFYINGSNNIDILDCSMVFSTNGIIGTSNSNLTFDSLLINNSSNNGINIGSSNSTIKNCTIKNSGTICGFGKNGDDTYQAVILRGKKNLIENSIIDSTGYSAIRFEGDSVKVQNNFINNFCLVKNDGGGIYTWKGTGDNSINKERVIRKNIILNGIGAFEGTNLQESHAHGIYIDDNSNTITISENSIANCKESGIYIHNSEKLSIEKNTVFNNRQQIRFVHDYIVPNTPLKNLNVDSNIFFSGQANQLSSTLTSLTNDFGLTGTFNKNYYCRPLDDNFLITTTISNSSTYKSSVYDLFGWKRQFGLDSLSKKSPVRIVPFQINSISNTNKFSNGSFNSSITGVSFWSASGNCTPSWSNAGQLDNGCLKVTFNSSASPSVADRSALLTFPIGSVSNSKSYLLKFSLKGQKNFRNFQVFLRKQGSPYNDLTQRFYCSLADVRTENEFAFSFPQNESNAFLVFQIDQADSTLFIDNIQLYEANLTITDPDDYIRFEYNASNLPKSISLNEAYVDPKNITYSNSIILQPYTSIVLLKKTGNLVAYIDSTQQMQTQIINFPSISAHTYGDAPFTINATASSELPVSFSLVSGPATLSGNTVILTGTGTIIIAATQPGNNLYSAAAPVQQAFVVSAPISPSCSDTGSITYERWDSIIGSNISSIPVNTTPDSIRILTSFEKTAESAINFGARLRGYVCPPQTGNYTFWIAGDDKAQLWLSSSSTVSGKALIASVPDWTSLREFTKYPSQKSASIYLQAGKLYYMEALYKQGVGGNHTTVSWLLPNGTIQTPIPGSNLVQFGANYSNNITAITQVIETVGTNTFNTAKLSPVTVADESSTIFKVYPNPIMKNAIIEVSVKSNNAVTIELFDQQGKVVKKLYSQLAKTGLSKKLPFCVSELTSGLYILQLKTAEKVFTQKVIVQ